jgi:type IV pilus assembly protein PilY1
VLYASNLSALWVSYGTVKTGNGITVTPPNTNTPYTAYGLGNYNNGGVLVSYSNSLPSGIGGTSPTNAGYVPFSSQVMYVQRGFGYGGSQSATTGTTAVAMTGLSANPTTAQITTAYNQFKPLLEPETNVLATGEIKAIAGQAATAGLMVGAGNALAGLPATCAGQYVILLTDGLPTMSLDSKAWPPLGSESGSGYGVYATFAGMPANASYGLRDGSSSTLPAGSFVPGGSNNQALIDTIAKITDLHTRGIKTYVVGLGAGVDATQNPAANATLNAMAIAGGTAQQYPASDIPSFQAALAAIAQQIYTSVQVSAPVAPGSVSSGSKVYIATSKNQSGGIGGHIDATRAMPRAGHRLFAVGRRQPLPDECCRAQGQSLVNPIHAGQCPRRLRALAKLADMGTATSADYDAAAFAWTASTCVPTLRHLLAYTFNPTYGTLGDTGSGGMSFPTAIGGCSYLAGREPNWMMGSDQ